MDRKELASKIEHAFLKPDAEIGVIERGCRAAEEAGIGAVVVQPCHVRAVSSLLESSPTKVVAVIGFPMGGTYTEAKVLEARMAVEEGADELDLVMNLSLFASGRYQEVQEDLEKVIQASHGRPVKVILETSLWDEGAIVKGCHIARDAGASFVKSSTGFFGGAEEWSVRLMRKTVGNRMGVKASGGIKDLSKMLAMLSAGADRIGTSSTFEILDQWDKRFKG
ncbi:deoxyribose-phosphate aldolase [Thermanaerovibrio velox DSM 12556]|uniref:Deoxyribose-phosphate aldolase n=1 Tax=Thermanaerovibrio velox DSM 12556 TaxID=926567 RepID=H0UR35_9BACT|nr:deoxyribose-phosphate aldolase [Thermanaerovibrio velox]EHM10872.1 deoxyribose-phosphate aldolase [Thermanaerovibrio velox DSM 12556]